MWHKEENDLDKVKKFKFPSHIHTILTLKNTATILVMQNGATISLQMALENRKNWSSNGILKPSEKIVKCQLVQLRDKTHLCAITIIDDACHFISIPLETDNFTGNVDQIIRIELRRSAEKLIGYVVLSTDNDIYLLTLCKI